MVHGDCSGVDTKIFFSFNIHERNIAKAICADCDVREQCLREALRRREPWGIWGGIWFEDGRMVKFDTTSGRRNPDVEPIYLDIPSDISRYNTRQYVREHRAIFDKQRSDDSEQELVGS